MEDIEAEVREWGRSLGVVIPKKVVTLEGIHAGDTIVLRVGKPSNALAEMFGTCKLKRSTDDLLKESDEDGWDE